MTNSAELDQALCRPDQVKTAFQELFFPNLDEIETKLTNDPWILNGLVQPIFF